MKHFYRSWRLVAETRRDKKVGQRRLNSETGFSLINLIDRYNKASMTYPNPGVLPTKSPLRQTRLTPNPFYTSLRARAPRSFSGFELSSYSASLPSSSSPCRPTYSEYLRMTGKALRKAKNAFTKKFIAICRSNGPETKSRSCDREATRPRPSLVPRCD